MLFLNFLYVVSSRFCTVTNRIQIRNFREKIRVSLFFPHFSWPRKSMLNIKHMYVWYDSKAIFSFFLMVFLKSFYVVWSRFYNLKIKRQWIILANNRWFSSTFLTCFVGLENPYQTLYIYEMDTIRKVIFCSF